MKIFFGGLIGLCIVIILFITRCDKTCQMTKQITENLKQAQEQQDIYSGHVDRAGEYYKKYQEEIKQASKAKVLQWRHEKTASKIYGSGVAFGNYAYAGWDEGLTGTTEEIKVVETGSIKTGFTWRVNSAGKSKHRSELCITDCTFTGVLHRYGLPTQPFIDNETKYGIKKELAVCIAWADSHLGRALKSTNNIGNVGNNDRGQVVHYKTIEAGIEAMYRVLNNKYLGHKQSVGSLSVGGGGSKPYYATSPENRHNNVTNCLGVLLNQYIEDDWQFRIK